MKEGAITTDAVGIKRIIREYYKQLYAKTFNKLESMENFLARGKIPKLN